MNDAAVAHGMVAAMHELGMMACGIAVVACLIVLLSFYAAQYEWVEWFILALRISYSMLWVAIIIRSSVAMVVVYRKITSINREDGGTPAVMAAVAIALGFTALILMVLWVMSKYDNRKY